MRAKTMAASIGAIAIGASPVLAGHTERTLRPEASTWTGWDDRQSITLMQIFGYVPSMPYLVVTDEGELIDAETGIVGDWTYNPSEFEAHIDTIIDQDGYACRVMLEVGTDCGLLRANAATLWVPLPGGISHFGPSVTPGVDPCIGQVPLGQSCEHAHGLCRGCCHDKRWEADLICKGGALGAVGGGLWTCAKACGVTASAFPPAAIPCFAACCAVFGVGIFGGYMLCQDIKDTNWNKCRNDCRNAVRQVTGCEDFDPEVE